VVFQYAIPYHEGFPLGPVAFVRGAAVGDVRSLHPVEWALHRGCPAGPSLEARDPSRRWPWRRLLAPVILLPTPQLLTVCATFLEWPSEKRIRIVVLPALTVLGSKIVLLQALNPAGGLPFQVLKIHEPR
jgi:hypothetical protein